MSDVNKIELKDNNSFSIIEHLKADGTSKLSMKKENICKSITACPLIEKYIDKENSLEVKEH